MSFLINVAAYRECNSERFTPSFEINALASLESARGREKGREGGGGTEEGYMKSIDCETTLLMR